jgi:ParB-like chromosome segregation protein Spo0J
MKEIKEFKNIPLNQILLDSSEKNNIPSAEVESIIDDIKEKGLIRPVIVYSKSSNEYILVLGMRRFFATKIIGHESIFCGIIQDEVTREEAAAISLCYTSLEGMLSNTDRNSAIKFLLDDTGGDIDKISSLTDISEENLKAYIDA